MDPAPEIPDQDLITRINLTNAGSRLSTGETVTAALARRDVLGLAFDGLGLHRVGLDVLSINTRAIAIYENIGFRHEGRLRAAYRAGDRWCDSVVMGILEDEWAAFLDDLHHVDDLGAVIDMEAVRGSGLRLGVDPLGGASLAYASLIERNLFTLRRFDVPVLEPDPLFFPQSIDSLVRTADGSIELHPLGPVPLGPGPLAVGHDGRVPSSEQQAVQALRWQQTAIAQAGESRS